MASKIQGAWADAHIIESEVLNAEDLEAITRMERIIDRDGRIEVLGSRAVHIWRLAEES